MQLLRQVDGPPKKLASLEPTPPRLSGSKRTPAKSIARFQEIVLPSGSSLTEVMMRAPKKWHTKLFPREAPVYVARHPDMSVRGVYTISKWKLHGPAASLYPHGRLQALGHYYSSRPDGPLRVWDENGRYRLYAERVRGRKRGLVCLFEGGLPRLIQEWEGDKLLREFLIEFTGDTPVVTAKEKLDPERLRSFLAAHTELAELEEDLAQQEKELKKELADEVASLKQKLAAERSVMGRKAISAAIKKRNQAKDAAAGAFWRRALQGTGL